VRVKNEGRPDKSTQAPSGAGRTKGQGASFRVGKTIARLYGATEGGGLGTLNPGTVFELTPNAARTKWTETALHNFCANHDCTDGETPVAGLIMDGSGNLYGTASEGGAHGGGTVFELKP
jgi:uncharacterized repeat protein (TIGR03803 family)